MSKFCKHMTSERFHDETFGLSVYEDQSALFSIVTNGVISCAVALEPTENGSGIALAGDARQWFDRELAAGRAKVPS